MKIEFDITLTDRDMYRFSMHHAYTGSQGIISIVLAVLSFIVTIKTYGFVESVYTVLYAAAGVVFLFYMPLNLYLRSKRQFLMSIELQNALHYLIDDQGIHTSQNDASADLPWEQIYKIISTKEYVYIYSNRINAYIIPRVQIAEYYGQLQELAGSHLPTYRVKMK